MRLFVAQTEWRDLPGVRQGRSRKVALEVRATINVIHDRRKLTQCAIAICMLRQSESVSLIDFASMVNLATK